MSRLPHVLFRWLGRRYPGFLLLVEFQVAHIVTAGGLGMLTLYQPMSVGQFFLIFGVAQGLVFTENLFATVLIRRMLRPVRRWLRGARDEATTVSAWEAIVGLPIGFLRRWKWVPLAISLPLVSGFITWQLALEPVAMPVLFAGSLVVLGYGATLRFFAVEIALRPVLADVARELPEGIELPSAGVSLRLRLLAALPMISLISGAVAAGVASQGSELADLGLDVLAAIGVAGAISLELTLLLSRSILGPLGELREATERLGRGNLSVRVPVLSSDETGRLAQSFNRMAAGLEERERLREAFGTFIDPNLAERVMHEGALAGEEVEVSVLFLDIRDFTAWAERSSAREVVARLNVFYELVVPVLHRHRGHANKFVGDGLLGVFGTPDPLADHADRALAAAVEIAQLVRRRYGDDLRIGIGLNSGPVLAGTVGGGGRLDFTVIGDPVNTAARVEGATRETGDVVLLTQATRALLSEAAPELVERPAVELRGKSERVRLYAPSARSADVEGRRARAAGSVTR